MNDYTRSTQVPMATPQQTNSSLSLTGSTEPILDHKLLTNGSSTQGHLAVPHIPAASANVSSFIQNRTAPVPPSLASNLEPFQSASQEILKRVSAARNITAGSPEWEAARQQVLKSMGSSTAMDFPKSSTARPATVGQVTSGSVDTTPIRRGAPRGRPKGSGRGVKSLGRGRGRGSGKIVKGGKRKRNDSEAETGGEDTDASESYTPLATVTKSGRNVTKPSQFVPNAESSPGTSQKRKRSYKRGAESALCMKCQRGHSPESNMIVFCDGCSAAYHQWCHDPLIERHVIDIPEQEWFCMDCKSKKEMEELKVEDRVSSQTLNLTDQEKSVYLSTLSKPTLIHILLHVDRKNPSLPIFAPNTRTIVDEINTDQTPTHISTSALPTPPISDPSSLAIQNQTDTNGTTSSSSTTAIPTSTPGPTLEDPYPDYTNDFPDPPSTYPRPGNGPYKLQPTTDVTDMPWLMDDTNDIGFSHLEAEMGLTQTENTQLDAGRLVPLTMQDLTAKTKAQALLNRRGGRPFSTGGNM